MTFLDWLKEFHAKENSGMTFEDWIGTRSYIQMYCLEEEYSQQGERMDPA